MKEGRKGVYRIVNPRHFFMVYVREEMPFSNPIAIVGLKIV